MQQQGSVWIDGNLWIDYTMMARLLTTGALSHAHITTLTIPMQYWCEVMATLPLQTLTLRRPIRAITEAIRARLDSVADCVTLRSLDVLMPLFHRVHTTPLVKSFDRGQFAHLQHLAVNFYKDHEHTWHEAGITEDHVLRVLGLMLAKLPNLLSLAFGPYIRLRDDWEEARLTALVKHSPLLEKIAFNTDATCTTSVRLPESVKTLALRDYPPSALQRILSSSSIERLIIQVDWQDKIPMFVRNIGKFAPASLYVVHFHNVRRAWYYRVGRHLRDLPSHIVWRMRLLDPRCEGWYTRIRHPSHPTDDGSYASFD